MTTRQSSSKFFNPDTNLTQWLTVGISLFVGVCVWVCTLMLDIVAGHVSRRYPTLAAVTLIHCQTLFDCFLSELDSTRSHYFSSVITLHQPRIIFWNIDECFCHFTQVNHSLVCGIISQWWCYKSMICFQSPSRETLAGIGDFSEHFGEVVLASLCNLCLSTAL